MKTLLSSHLLCSFRIVCHERIQSVWMLPAQTVATLFRVSILREVLLVAITEVTRHRKPQLVHTAIFSEKHYPAADVRCQYH